MVRSGDTLGSMQASHPSRDPDRQADLEAEAARYALMRRLAPSMRHHLVVNLQPIGMIHEVMERRLAAPQPDLAHLRESAGKINGFARAALASCNDVVGWLAPDEAAGIAVDAAVREAAGLLATSLGFRGYALRNEVTPLAGEVRRSAVRCLLAGALLHLADHLPPPAHLCIAAEAGAGAAVLRITVQDAEGEQGFSTEAGYRKLDWNDLQALAAADGVQLERQQRGLEMRLPWLRAA